MWCILLKKRGKGSEGRRRESWYNLEKEEGVRRRGMWSKEENKVG